jgi:iturin family lipopeptide synthetase B
LSRHCTYFNAYGPTECSVCLTIQPVADLPESRLRVPIGRPLANTRLYLLDRNRELVPVGVPGQIYAAGPGLARGYVNQEALTAQKFVPNPFEPGGRLYASGDLGQWLEDGTVDFIGRADFQEKIRGYRIEPAEVEHALLAHPDVRNALVMGRTDSQGSRQLVAYVESGPTVDTGSLRRFLQQRLPEYMIPAWLVPVAAMPLTGSGKIDRDQLPLPETAPEAAGAYREARNEIEEKLVRIWESVLGKPKVGVKDNFFLSGGDSIKAIQVASRLNGSGYRLDIRDLFETPVLEDLAPRVVPVRRVADQSPVTGAVPLTPIQRHFFATVATAPWHYNQSVMLTAPAGFDPEAVRAVFTKIQEHHDALRMTFQGAGAAVVQENASLALPLSLAVFEADAPEADPGVLDRLQESFSLAQGPLMKLALFRHPAGDQLLIVIHHLVVDGVSWRVLLEDIGQLFGQYREGQPLCLPPKTDSFRAWAHALASYADSLAFGAEKAYWEAMEQGDSAPLPVDFVTGTNQVQDARRVSAVLPVADTGLLLTTVHEAYNTTINDLLLAALGTCLQEAFGVTRAVVFLEGHGREESIGELDVSRTVGWFTSWYPVALTGGDGSDWARQIKQTKETLRRVPNKGIGYGLFRYLSGSRPVAATLPPRLVFNYLGQFDADFSGHPFGVSGAGTGHEKPAGQERGSGLVVTGMVTGGQLSLSIEYNVGQYREETIRGLLYRYREALEGVIRHCTEQTERELTPSDLTYKDLSLEALQSISSMFN